MTDPRIARTRDHVLQTAIGMLAVPSGEPLTFSTLAAEAQVSRRTLYVHWGTMQQILSDIIGVRRTRIVVDPSENASPRDILKEFLTALRNDLHEPVTALALTALLSQAAQDERAADIVLASSVGGTDEISSLLGPVTQLQLSLLIGPLFYSEFFLRTPASNAIVDDLVDTGMRTLGLQELTTSD
ncbi:TetR/AcrR family transcriptional regulator [Glaciihabitans sp. dw_435]|uniref:TetR/AcrR family transcriptional regulator n=1 Tax=Glaciihabitans sp. dw_435 TaxID=2720081 RepID=UPI001BD20585|nr:TetR/AcrR family transcriptional regulator [Glaciihabitans sp. dw_435]